MNHVQSKNWSLSRAENNIATLCFDMPGEKVNKFTPKAMDELEINLKALHENHPKALLITSSKPGIFIAGADIEDIQSIQTAREADSKLQKGQGVFNLIESLPCLTVAIIDGACMGGGMECALACDERWVTDSPKTKLALPEVKLGLLPGWGGTQRLPRLIGLQASLDLLLTGRSYDSKKALRCGLADRVFSQTFLKSDLSVALKARLEGTERSKPRWKKTLINRLINDTPFGMHYALRSARKSVLEKGGPNYPAPIKILDLLAQTLRGSFVDGLEKERNAFCSLITGTTARNLIQLYFSNESIKKQPGIGSEDGAPLQKGAVIGAGIMGGGISWLLSGKGMGVRLKDISQDALGLGLKSAHAMNHYAVKRRRMTASEMDNSMDRIATTLDWKGFHRMELILEAVVEKMNIKKGVLSELEQHCSESAIICSNTSALSISEMATSLKKPERFIGMHFFNPVNRMPLVEIIPGPQTSPETITRVFHLAKQLGKTPIVVKDVAGFLVNRILLATMNEAARCLEDGAGIDSVDRVMTTFGLPMGPFHLTDEVGIEVGFHVAKTLEEAYGDRMIVSGVLNFLHEGMGLKGKKDGKGFYIWKDGQKEVNRNLESRWKKDGGPNENDILDRCTLTMVNESLRCLEEGVVHNAMALDMAMILGTGFPPFRGGPIRYAENYGVQACYERLKSLANHWGPRFEPAPILVEHAKHSRPFYA